MKHILFLIVSLLAVCLFSFTSCKTVPESINKYSYHYQEATIKYSYPERNETSIFPTVADLEISNEKVTYAETFTTMLEMTPSQFKKFVEALNNHLLNGTEPPFVKNWKSQVIAKAAIKYEADEIVSPIFIITPNETKTSVTVTVTGYIGKYKDFRNATENDIKFLKEYYSVK